MSFFLQNSATILQQIRAKIMQKVEHSAKILIIFQNDAYKTETRIASKKSKERKFQ